MCLKIAKTVCSSASKTSRHVGYDTLPLSFSDHPEQVEEYFLPGHKHNIRKHTFTPSDSGPGTRDMEFYSRARADGLIRRLDTGVEVRSGGYGVMLMSYVDD